MIAGSFVWFICCVFKLYSNHCCMQTSTITTTCLIPYWGQKQEAGVRGQSLGHMWSTLMSSERANQGMWIPHKDQTLQAKLTSVDKLRGLQSTLSFHLGSSKAKKPKYRVCMFQLMTLHFIFFQRTENLTRKIKDINHTYHLALTLFWPFQTCSQSVLLIQPPIPFE